VWGAFNWSSRFHQCTCWRTDPTRFCCVGVGSQGTTAVNRLAGPTGSPEVSDSFRKLVQAHTRASRAGTDSTTR
jgi:hypothetical protein